MRAKPEVGPGSLREQPFTVEEHRDPVVAPTQIERSLKWWRQPERDHGAITGEALGDKAARVATLGGVRRPAVTPLDHDPLNDHLSTEPTISAGRIASGGHLVSSPGRGTQATRVIEAAR